LEKRCGLSALTPLPGCEADEHVEAFGVWREWLRTGILSAPFEVVHVDAHSDLGSGWGTIHVTPSEKGISGLPSVVDVIGGSDQDRTGDLLNAISGG